MHTYIQHNITWVIVTKPLTQIVFIICFWADNETYLMEIFGKKFSFNPEYARSLNLNSQFSYVISQMSPASCSCCLVSSTSTISQPSSGHLYSQEVLGVLPVVSRSHDFR